MADEVVRNIQLKLDIPESRHDDVDATFDEFQYAAQYVSDYGWDSDPDKIVTAKNQLHDATYTDVRDQTTLQASLVQSARNLEADALSNGKELLDDGKRTSNPEFKGTVVVYNSRTLTYNDDHVTLATVSDRVKADYVLPRDDEGTPFETYWTEEWEKNRPRSTSVTVSTTSTLPSRKQLNPLLTIRPRTEWFLGLTSTWMGTSQLPARERSSATQTN